MESNTIKTKRMKHFIKIIILLFALNVGAQSTSTAKIYTKGNYFIIQQNDKEYSGPMKDVIVYQLTVDSEFYYFKNLENWTNDGLKVVNIVNESGTPYTTQTWETFYTENTGSFSNGGGSGNTGSQFTEVSNLTTADYIYKSGMLGTAWQVNRYDRNNNMAQTTATQTNNTTITTLADAVTGILTLNYS